MSAHEGAVEASGVPGGRAPSIAPTELAKFEAMAAEWWDPHGKFRPLHRFNPTRLRFIRDTAIAHFGRDPAARRPLEGLRLIDIGCGGGLVSEPMARLGARVTAIDAGERNVKTAMAHARASGLSIDYRVGAVEDILAAQGEAFDIVLTLEVVEHVADPHVFLLDCARLLAPGGLMVVASINRTRKAFALAIVAAERILRWLPPGTHEYDRLVTPEEAARPLRESGLSVSPPIGVGYNPIADRWSISADADVNYMLTATRSAT
jgi:2-polyprenyl-6-hydroxyphenyl methylase/3-demethylubiquinone-9 3-methyltransferase